MGLTFEFAMFHFKLFKPPPNVGLSVWRQFLQAGLGAHVSSRPHAAHRTPPETLLSTRRSEMLTAPAPCDRGAIVIALEVLFLGMVVEEREATHAGLSHDASFVQWMAKRLHQRITIPGENRIIRFLTKKKRQRPTSSSLPLRLGKSVDIHFVLRLQ